MRSPEYIWVLWGQRPQAQCRARAGWAEEGVRGHEVLPVLGAAVPGLSHCNFSGLLSMAARQVWPAGVVPVLSGHKSLLRAHP